MRKLASIKQISNILPIEGKDRIVLAIVDGWQVIVRKDEYQIGDKTIFVEIDSVLPERDEFEFLRSKKFRIKTMKMSGVLSQGICFPLSILQAGDYKLEDDVTDILSIKQYDGTMDSESTSKEINTKYHYPAFLMKIGWFRKLVLPKKQTKGFPEFISKTDETRIQNIPSILNNKVPYIVTEKIDGQSGTFVLKRVKSKLPFIKDKYEFIVCSRNLRLWREDNSSYWKVVKKYKIENVLRNCIGERDWIALQGECVSPSVQGNKYHVTEPDLYVFNMIYPSGRLDSLTARNICEQHGLQFVPIIDTDFILLDTVNEMLDYANGQSQLYPTLREGIVFRSKDGKTSFKAVDPIFLMKYDE